MDKILEKVFTKKSIKWIMLCCAVFLLAYQIISFVDNVAEDSSQSLVYLIPSLLWTLSVLSLIAYGTITNKDNFVSCGVLLTLGVLINAFVNGFSALSNVANPFKYGEVLRGFYLIFTSIAFLSLAVAFVSWLLRKYFKVKVDERVITYAVYVVVISQLLAFVFMLLSYTVYGYPISAVSIIGSLSLLAYLGIFLGYYFSHDEAKTSKFIKKEEQQSQPVEEEMQMAKEQQKIDEPKLEE
ncbi:MAG: hypothetical protein KBT30_01885 [Clostridiales bacterium]|nr:hypothetical protein [Candidatus Apopatousia equi]